MFAHARMYMIHYSSNIHNCLLKLYRNITLKQFRTKIVNIENIFFTQSLR